MMDLEEKRRHRNEGTPCWSRKRRVMDMTPTLSVSEAGIPAKNVSRHEVVATTTVGRSTNPDVCRRNLVATAIPRSLPPKGRC